MLIPPFLAGDVSSKPLIRHIDKLGYRASGWGQGRNTGIGKVPLSDVVMQIKNLARESKGKITVIGHSLGGIYAREAAKLAPESVRHVITLASPFGAIDHGKGVHPRVQKMYEFFNRDQLDRSSDSNLLDPPPVPTSAVFSNSDGICKKFVCVQHGDHEMTQNVEVVGSHSGFMMNPNVWVVLASLLTQSEENWTPIE